jgi:hypothetical protein
MASVMALNEGWTDADGKVSPIDFEVLDNFKSLRDGVNGGKAAAFMWEKFTTKVSRSNWHHFTQLQSSSINLR